MPFSERVGNSTPIHYRSVRCSGEEDRLTDCPGISTATASCLHTQDVYIVCRPSSGRISRKLYQVFCHGIFVPMISYLPSYWCSHIASPLCFSPIPHSIVTSKLCLKHFIAAHPFFSRTYLRLPAHTNQIPTHMRMLGQCSYLHSADLTLHPPHISFPIRIPQLLPHLFYWGEPERAPH